MIFFSQFTLIEYKKGQILLRPDEDPKGIYYLTKGTVKTFFISEKGSEIILNIFKPQSFFPMSWAINNVQNVYFYETTTDVKLWKAPRSEVLKFIKQNPDILFNLLSRMYKGVDGLLMRLTYLMAGSAHVRLINELIIVAKRFGRHEENGIEVNISEKDIAMQTGLTRETVSREMTALKKKGLIILNKKLLKIIDIEKLTNELLENS